MSKTPKILPPSDEDNLFWQEQTKNIKEIERPENIISAPVVLPEIRNTVNLHEAYSGNRLTELTTGETGNIDRRTAQKFTRGEMPIERRLDLHGLTEDKAFDAVQNFIKSSYRQDMRCVLIITGKGLHKEDDDFFSQSGILKNRVPQWLNSETLRPLILSFADALPKDGGSGALYVLLRRRRK